MTAATALAAEARALVAALVRLAPGDWNRPTRCVPWTVRDLVGHVITAVGRVPDMISEPEPGPADTTALTYYRADDRFSESTNADRIETARNRAAGADPVRELKSVVAAAVSVQPGDRVVRTRHGDAMLLNDFLSTRVVEVAVHGLDVADAVDREPWLTGEAAQHLRELLFGDNWPATLHWDPVTLVRKTTGRGQVTADESAELAALGLRPLTLG